MRKWRDQSSLIVGTNSKNFSIEDVSVQNRVSSSPEGIRELQLVKRKLSEQQLTTALLGSASTLIAFLTAGRVLLTSYYIIVLFCWIDLVTQGGILLSNYRYVCRRRQHVKARISTNKGADRVLATTTVADSVRPESQRGERSVAQ